MDILDRLDRLDKIYRLDRLDRLLDRDGEWIKRARGNSSGARTACEEFCYASHGNDEDSSGPLICLWADLHRQVPNWRK